MLKAVSSSTSARRAAAIILENSRDWCNPAHKTSSCCSNRAGLLLLLAHPNRFKLIPYYIKGYFTSRLFSCHFSSLLCTFLDCIFMPLFSACQSSSDQQISSWKRSSFLPSRKENGKDPSIHDQTSSSKGKKGRLGLLVSVSSSNLKVDTFDPCNGIICYPTSRKLIRLITNNAPLLSSVCYEWKRRPRSAIIVEGVPYRKCLPAELGL